MNYYAFIIIAVFISGLMVGRTPEFLGKKIEAREMKIATMVVLMHPLIILVGTALASHLAAQNPETGRRLAQQSVVSRIQRNALRIYLLRSQ